MQLLNVINHESEVMSLFANFVIHSFSKKKKKNFLKRISSYRISMPMILHFIKKDGLQNEYIINSILGGINVEHWG